MSATAGFHEEIKICLWKSLLSIALDHVLSEHYISHSFENILCQFICPERILRVMIQSCIIAILHGV